MSTRLPGTALVGSSGTWLVPSLDGEDAVFGGRFLGVSSSRARGHVAHPGEYARKSVRCSACRWSELRIFKRTSGWYVVHTLGRSCVPGEIDGYRPHARFVLTPPEVLETLTTRLKPRPGGTAGERVVFFSDAAARVLAQASAFDEQIQDAWENRRVA